MNGSYSLNSLGSKFISKLASVLKKNEVRIFKVLLYTMAVSKLNFCLWQSWYVFPYLTYVHLSSRIQLCVINILWYQIELWGPVQFLQLSIIELLGHCKVGNFNIHILAWFRYFICSRREIIFFLFGKELISCLSRPNMHAFNENRDPIYTDSTFINP